MTLLERVHKETISTDRCPRPLANYSQAARAGQFLFLAGQIASDYQTGIPAEARRDSEFPYYGSDIRRQTRYVMDNIGAVLEAGGSSFEQIVKAQVFLKDAADFDGFDEVYRSYFKVPPPRTTLQVGERALLVPGALVEVDFLALTSQSGVEREVLDVPGLPSPIAHYSPVVRAGQFVFPAGQVATDFKTGVAAEARVHPAFPYYGSEIEQQARYILGNLQKTLQAAGSSLADVIKAQVFLRSLHDFDAFDQVWKEFFPTPPPRTTIQIGQLLIPDCLVEIDLIGVVPGQLSRQVINTDACPRPLANYSQATRVGPYVFLAGQLASDFRTGIPPEARVDPNFRWYGSDIARQTEYILRNCQTVLEAAGSSLANVVKAQVFLTDLRNFYQFDKVWKRFFGEHVPPRTTVETAGDGLLVPGSLVEIDLIAVAD